MTTKLFKVYSDGKLTGPKFTEKDEATAWAVANCKYFNIFKMELIDGRIETTLDGCDFGIYFAQAEENKDNLVYLDDELVGRFPEKARRDTVLCAINKMNALIKAEEERYREEDAFYESQEGPYGGAFVDEVDFARHVGIDLKY